MTNQAKIIISLVAVLALVYAVFAFDVGRKSGPDFTRIDDLIRVDEPDPDDTIGSPATFNGEARGMWFFEATFPIDIYAANGTVIGRGFAEAQGEWMTEEFVQWVAIVNFNSGSNTTGYVRFMKDNPSGLPENDAHIDVPVRFRTSGTGTTTAAACRPTGCSGQICADEDVVSTCEFRPEYACYRNAACERQASGQCGWTQTPALLACLANPPQE